MSETLKKLARTLWGIYAWLVFAVFSVVTTVLVAVVPGLPARRRVARASARLIFSACGISLSVRDLGGLPDEACVVVANHASYLDGVILQAALPPRFSFVIKQEMRNIPLAHLLLRRIGSEFVERHDRHKGATDARRLMRKAHGGEALAFFPEGTFQKRPGLGLFRSGAFAAAARAGLAVVPVVIIGSRHILPAQAILPRPGSLEVVITGPLALPSNPAAATARQLADASRQRILAHLDEPALDVFIPKDADSTTETPP